MILSPGPISLRQEITQRHTYYSRSISGELFQKELIRIEISSKIERIKREKRWIVLVKKEKERRKLLR